MNKDISNIIQSFAINDKILSITPFGNGHINDTFKVLGEKQSYLLQRINHHIFQRPMDIMENMIMISNTLKSNSYPKKVLEPILTKRQKPLLKVNDVYWRILPFFENTVSLEKVENTSQAFEAAQAIGEFTAYLDNFDTEQLKVIIPDFHNGTLRWQQFQNALNEDRINRVARIKKFINEVIEENPLYLEISKVIKSSKLPLRVTHNDTKINNFLFNQSKDKIVAVIDWDTIMPNTVLSDFGDMVRTFCNSTDEDEANLSKIVFDKDIYDALLNGYRASTQHFLTELELQCLNKAGIWMTYMQTLRFLTDYLNGDIYYKISYSEHNLVRAKNQFSLLKQMNKC